MFAKPDDICNSVPLTGVQMFLTVENKKMFSVFAYIIGYTATG